MSYGWSHQGIKIEMESLVLSEKQFALFQTLSYCLLVLLAKACVPPELTSQCCWHGSTWCWGEPLVEKADLDTAWLPVGIRHRFHIVDLNMDMSVNQSINQSQ